MKQYLALLGDPAKLELYDEKFYSVLKQFPNNIFHLIGASENDVGKDNYNQMYENIKNQLTGIEFSPIPGLSSGSSRDFNCRVGLFPSSSSHLINGPDFVFAPLPINSQSRYLRFKARFLSFILDPFIQPHIRPLAYLPLGGKAATKTKADTKISIESIQDLFYDARQNRWFEWFYLEAGSGESMLQSYQIQQVLLRQFEAIRGVPKGTISTQDSLNMVIPNSIYGGGIRSVGDLDDLLLPTEPPYLTPQIIVIGNLSELSINSTYDVVERFCELIVKQ